MLPVRELPAIIIGLAAVYRELLMIYREIRGHARILDAGPRVGDRLPAHRCRLVTRSADTAD